MYFPRDYSDAVVKFRGAVAGLKGESGRWNVGPGLDVDHQFWPAQVSPGSLLILMSGVHGPETYAGHAIQMMFLREVWPKIQRDHCGVFLVHSLNPYGFKNHTRCTENGVNLNRNCSTDAGLYKIQNPASLELERKFIPRVPVRSNESYLLQTMRREGGQIRFAGVALDEFIRGVAMGQYTDPKGLEFGGFQAEPQIAALIERLREILPGYRNVLFFDLHTGLGHRGRLHLLSGDKKSCVDPALMKEVLDPAVDQDIYEYTPNNEQGFYRTYGATNDLMTELMEPGQRLCALTMEFGTIGHDLDSQIQGMNVWMNDHQGTHYGFAEAALEKTIKAEHFERFYPSAKSWGDAVLHSSRQLFSRVLERAGHFPRVD